MGARRGGFRKVRSAPCVFCGWQSRFSPTVLASIYKQNVSGDFFFHMQINSASSF